ncbi:WXG100 family type VII secretion target [Mycobacterium sp. OTB74]|uniref:WXG100 family type VII secretion target n=1 Tax=Mycobacterium sp. OTB74 TaxID=1853452 RepID=UPI00247632E1|nr:WXG100 family type VII secretion target [Mycobacterium sp. OTB74]MDH6246369.1 uncharacterized protein YukE [Mycobacterium sp. OTB74]
MSEQEWHFADIETAIGQLNSEHEKLHGLVTTQRARIQLVSSDVWNGSGREGWQDAEKAWSAKADAAVEALSKLIKSIQAGHDSMQQAENTLKGKFA